MGRKTVEKQDRASLYYGLAGLGLFGLGSVGLFFTDLLRMKFDLAHDLFHLVTGAVVIYGLITEKEWLTILLPLGIGTIYLFLGIGGFLSPTLWGIGEAMGLHLEFVENVMHLIIGGLGLYAGLAPSDVPRWSQA
jgi:hypothetical protein